MSRKKAGIDSWRRRAAWLAIVALPVLVGATGDEASLFKSRRLRIEGMTQAELNRLKWNYANFKTMPPDRRDALVKLHNELEQDTRENGHLQKLVDDYNQWLSNLSLFEREKLLKIEDPAERAQEVKKVFDEQKKRRATAASAKEIPLFGMRRGPAFNERLTPQDLDAVVDAVESKFLTASTKQRRRIDLKRKRERHVRVFDLAMKQTKEESESGRPPFVASDKMVAVMSEAIKDPKLKSGLEELDDFHRRTKLGLLTAHALYAEWQTEIEANMPDNEALDTLVKEREARLNLDERKQLNKSQERKTQERQMIALFNALPKLPFRGVGPVLQWSNRGFIEGGFGRLGQFGRGGRKSPGSLPKKSADGTRASKSTGTDDSN
jgi:hypothetical protein